MFSPNTDSLGCKLFKGGSWALVLGLPSRDTIYLYIASTGPIFNPDVLACILGLRAYYFKPHQVRRSSGMVHIPCNGFKISLPSKFRDATIVNLIRVCEAPIPRVPLITRQPAENYGYRVSRYHTHMSHILRHFPV